jgi:flagellar motor switch protein FliM
VNGIPKETKLSREEKIRIRREILQKHARDFRKEFNKQLLIFITGAFSFMAALVWNSAIQEIITNYKTEIFSYLPLKDTYFVDIAFAFVVTCIAVIAIIIVSKVLKVE